MKLLDILPQNETWQIIDQSKLVTYLNCPRKFFYSYVLGWKSDYPSNHLTFGSAWHEAVEHLLLNDYSKDSLVQASLLFLNRYRQDFGSETDEMFAPKDPKNALVTLSNYSQRFFRDTKEYEILFTEIGGQVYIAPNHPMSFKMDVIVRNRETGQISLWDHKTSQRRMGNWQESYSMDTQMHLYLHALYCMYGVKEDKVKGAKIRCTFFYKSKPSEFEETLIEKSPDQMQNFLYSTFNYYSQLKNDMEILLNEDSTEEENMHAFPMNPTSCFDYGKSCLFLDLCKAWPNPIIHVDSPPIGMKVEFWNPLEDKKIKTLIDLK